MVVVVVVQILRGCSVVAVAVVDIDIRYRTNIKPNHNLTQRTISDKKTLYNPGNDIITTVR